jgi:tRNA-Thr(GGU) m(6)t(6)A37 methyltransferase TsaA
LSSVKGRPARGGHAAVPRGAETLTESKAQKHPTMNSLLRLNEIAAETPPAKDAGLIYIGRIHTPWADRLLCPRQGRQDGPICRIEVFPQWIAALDGVAQYEKIEVLYWFHLSRRDLLRQSPRSDGIARGTFSLRSPLRPNPIATSVVTLVSIERNELAVRGLDCVDGTPLLDLKPDRTGFQPPAPRQPGDDQVDPAL